MTDEEMADKAKEMITISERELIEHALCGSQRGKLSPFRNHFAAAIGTDACRTFEGLTTRGLATKGNHISDWSVLYHVTDSGAKAAGLNLPED